MKPIWTQVANAIYALLEGREFAITGPGAGPHGKIGRLSGVAWNGQGPIMFELSFHKGPVVMFPPDDLEIVAVRGDQ